MATSGEASGGFFATLIDNGVSAIAEWTVNRQAELVPDLVERYGSGGLSDLRADTRVRLSHLADALAFDEPALHTTQAAWTAAAYRARGMPVSDLSRHYEALHEVLVDRLPPTAKPMIDRHMGATAEAIGHATGEPPSHVAGDGEDERLSRAYLEALLSGDRPGSLGIAVKSLDRTGDVARVMDRVIRPAHAEIGRLWHLGQVGIAAEHFATATSEWVLPQLAGKVERAEPNGRTIVATSVGGDTHALGIRMVAECYELAGWRAYFLGPSTPALDVASAAAEERADAIAVSANLGCHIRSVRSGVHAVRAADLSPRPIVLVGGAPFNTIESMWRKVGADGTAPDAARAVAEGERLIALRDGAAERPAD
mgnify:CR=1 FL=1